MREYYKNELGFTHGLHAEGSLINTVCWLLFWDVVYDEPVPDAFRSPQQVSPTFKIHSITVGRFISSIMIRVSHKLNKD